jgi:hypothetical protein
MTTYKTTLKTHNESFLIIIIITFDVQISLLKKEIPNLLDVNWHPLLATT